MTFLRIGFSHSISITSHISFYSDPIHPTNTHTHPQQIHIHVPCTRSFPGSVIDPHISDDGTFVVFVCDNELYMASTVNVAAKGPLVQQITFDAHDDETGKQKEGIANGLSDFIAMEEMSRNEGT